MRQRTLRISNLQLSDVGPFSELFIDFNPKPGISLLCGSNGVGKTTILESIVAAFSRGQAHRIKRRQPANEGHISVNYSESEQNRRVQFQINTFDPEHGDFVKNSDEICDHIINIRASRDFRYQKQSIIARDPQFDKSTSAMRVAQDTDSSEIKSWLTNRYLLRHHAEKSSWTPQMLRNLDAAVSFFSILDDRVNLEEVDVTTFDILVSTPSGTIPFEFLSSGFRSAYALLLGILKEIEFRKLNVSSNEFSGVILIDEIDLHLHPSWQAKIGLVLKRAFPNAQIIATTHSPHVIQTAGQDEVIPLLLFDNGRVERRPVILNEYGFLGWTVEEILEDIMGVEDTRTPTFRAAMRDFDTALDEENAERLNSALRTLNAMLHPKNPLRKLLEIQSAPFVGLGIKGGLHN